MLYSYIYIYILRKKIALFAENFEKGHKLHYAIQQRLLGEPLELTPNIEGYWKSLQLVIPAIEHVYSQEDNVVHPYLHYRGIFDCLATYRYESKEE